jgi:protein-tyrosine phosphatase
MARQSAIAVSGGGWRWSDGEMNSGTPTSTGDRPDRGHALRDHADYDRRMSSLDTSRLRILMVCMGNICRSPTAEGVLRDRLRRAGLHERVEVDSAGTHSYHVGHPPDPRSVAHARRRGIDLSALRARRVREADFLHFDRIYAMDHGNLAVLEGLRPGTARARVALLLSVLSGEHAALEVPDPYSGGTSGFEHVLDLAERAADAIVFELATIGFEAPGNFGR